MDTSISYTTMKYPIIEISPPITFYSSTTRILEAEEE